MIYEFTIITSPVSEPLLLVALDESGIVQLKKVTGEEYELIGKYSETYNNFPSLKEMVIPKFNELQKLVEIGTGPINISLEEIKEFTKNPEKDVKDFIAEYEVFKFKLEEAKNWKKVIIKDWQTILEENKKNDDDSSEVFNKCLGVGKLDPLSSAGIFEHLHRISELNYELYKPDIDKEYIFIFGSEKMRNLTKVVFDAFNVEDILESLTLNVLPFAYDNKKHTNSLNEFNFELTQLQIFLENEKQIHKIWEKIETLQDLIKKETKKKFSQLIRRTRFLKTILEILSDERAQVLRTSLMTIIQGWVEKKNVESLKKIVEETKSKTGDTTYLSLKETSKDDYSVPTPPAKIQPSIFQPTTLLTSLRGWPSAHELNPSIINILIFCLQFGLMFGDVGQGLFYLLLGLIFTLRAKGMISKIGVMMIPMGISSVFFGFMYGEFFLLEGIIEPILYSPIHHIGEFMKLILGVALLEIILGLVISIINHIKKGERLEALGCHGLGAIFFIIGIYFTGIAFLEGLSVYELFNYWGFNLMIGGLILSAIIPFISSLHKGELSIDVLAEIISAVMICFVESLSSFFSFLRIGAYGLAHGSLSIAANSFSISTSPLFGLLLTNIIALSFEFISCTVQSTRLLYHEFMGKFYIGGGTKFKPFHLKTRSERLNLISEDIQPILLQPIEIIKSGVH